MAELDEKARDKEKSSGESENMKTPIQKPLSRGKQENSAAVSTTEYCEKLQEWMWQYYCGYMNWQSWIAMSAFFLPPCFPTQGATESHGTTAWGIDMSNGDLRNWLNSPFGFPAAAVNVAAPASGQSSAAPATAPVQIQQQQVNGNAQQPGDTVHSIVHHLFI